MSVSIASFSASSSHRTLVWALGVSVLVHAGLLTLKWVSPITFDRIFNTNTLEVVLVNSRSTQAPESPLALAQVNLAGGGQVAGTTLQTSPFKASVQEPSGQSLQQVEKKIETLKSEQLRLIQQLKEELSQLNSQTPTAASDGKANAANERQQQLAGQLAQIEKESQALQGGPKKRYVGPATKEVSFARYYDKMRRTIELTGTENFPQAAGEKLYGHLTMVITLDAKGRVLETEIANGSGNPLLDKRAQAIVRGASPFDAFTPEMKRQAEQLVVVSRFQFARDETLETKMLAPQVNATSAARTAAAQKKP
jgi:protein TonB